jgi:beta-glucosidase-like glycosyl hydrolase
MTILTNALASAATQPPFDAFDTLWTALLREANQRPHSTEQQRLLSLVEQLPPAALTRVTTCDAMTQLLNLDPPLETQQAYPHERLTTENTAHAIATIQNDAANAPARAIEAVGTILKGIRNKRAHGFKTTDPTTRDGEILRLATAVLHQLITELLANEPTSNS